MKKICFYLIVSSFFISNAQTNSVPDWINSNAIVIEDANPDSELIAFDKQAPQKFKDAQIYGFGEASHHGKEFFDLKAKFFKYLVQKQGVRIFIMEECYQAEAGINEWISGGKGNRATIADNFAIMPWYCNEVVDLLEWMRNYNQGKPKDDQIIFYGMDVQNGKKINLEIREFVTKYNIPIEANLLTVLDSCAEKPFGSHIKWATEQLPNLNRIENILLQSSQIKGMNEMEYKHISRVFNCLKSYVTYLHIPKFKIRDEGMFQNVLQIMSENKKEDKAFVWAHNDHINKNDQYGGLGKHLKAHYGPKYYSVGFDFGTGILPGIVIKKGEKMRWEYYTLKETYKNTFAETLYKAQPDVYFIDMDLALNEEPTGFFSKKNKHLGLGGPGFNPKKPLLMTRNFTDTYDALIFVKKINKSTKITQ